MADEKEEVVPDLHGPDNTHTWGPWKTSTEKDTIIRGCIHCDEVDERKINQDEAEPDPQTHEEPA